MDASQFTIVRSSLQRPFFEKKLFFFKILFLNCLIIVAVKELLDQSSLKINSLKDMLLKFDDSVRLWNKQNKYASYWTQRYKYTYFSDNFSDGAFIIKFCFSSKQPVINSLQTKGCQIMRYRHHDRCYKKWLLDILNVLQNNCRKIAVQQICQTNIWAKTDQLEKNRLQRN